MVANVPMEYSVMLLPKKDWYCASARLVNVPPAAISSASRRVRKKVGVFIMVGGGLKLKVES